MARQAFLEAETVLAREGGAITIIPIRVEQPPRQDSLIQESQWVNVGYIFDHVFAPTAGRLPAEPQRNGGPVDEALAAGAREFADEDRAMVEGEEPPAVMPQATDPADQHTEPRASDLPEPAPLDPAALVPRTQ
jgi:hypothetical protein